MALRNLVPLTFRPKGVSDTLDATNAFAGAMSALANLVPAPGTASVFVPRSASIQLTDFTGSGVTSPGLPSAILTVGTRVYGFAPGAGGKDYPFCYDIALRQFVPISGVTTALLPNSPLTSGDWTPPTICAVTTSRIIFTHPGFIGGSGPYFGWLDISGLTINDLTGNTTAGSPIITSINDGGTSQPIADGVQPGQTIAAGGVVSTVVSVTNGTFDLATTGNTDGSATITGVKNAFGVEPGMGVAGPTIDLATTVVSVSGAEPNYTVVLSKPTLSTSAGVALNFSGGGTITMATPASMTLTSGPISISGGSANAPLWGAGNTNTNPLIRPPRCVSQFNGRAWFGVGNAEIFSDPLNPCQVSAATQALFLGDDTPITASAGLPLTSQLTGGIVASLIIFKGAQPMYQITGDAAVNTLAQNVIQGSIGTLAPNSICNTPLGLAYMAIDGLRILSPTAQVSDPIGAFGDGVAVPFINAQFPSRMCAAFNQNTYRISVQNGAAPAAPWQEYALQFQTKKWHGPHSFPAALIQGYTAAGQQGFVLVGQSLPGKLWFHSLVPKPSDSYIENGQQLAFTFTTSLLPDNERMVMNKMVATDIALMLAGGTAVLASFTDESGTILDAANVFGALGGNLPVWGQATWGQFNWGALTSYFTEYRVPWDTLLVFKQGQFSVTGACGPNVALGNVYLGYQPLGYINQDLPVPAGYTALEATDEGGGVYTALMAAVNPDGTFRALEVGVNYG